MQRLDFDMSRLMAGGHEQMPDRKDVELRITTTFRDWKLDEPLPPETFRFKPPEDAEQVDSFFAGSDDDELHPMLGEKAPPIRLNLLDGGKFDLASHAGKDIVILDFWATWWGPCVQGLSTLAEVAKEYADRDVVVCAVNQQQSPQTIRGFLERRKLSIQVPLDEDGAVSDAYEVQHIPHTVIIGRDGIIHAVHVGVGPGMKTELKKNLEALLAGRNLADEKKREHAEQAEEKDHEDDPDVSPGATHGCRSSARGVRSGGLVGGEQAADFGQQVGGDGNGGLIAALGGGGRFIGGDPLLVRSGVQFVDQPLDTLLIPALGEPLFFHRPRLLCRRRKALSCLPSSR
jgi:peroxiredoxin